VIVSLLYKVTRRLLSVPAVLLRSESLKDAELLVLRRSTPGTDNSFRATLYSKDTITRTCSQLDSVGDLGRCCVS
jgi:hypothetical protein